MLITLAVPLACWLCALVALPRRPLPGDEAQELAYRRLIGRHHLLLACAMTTTIGLALALALRAVTAGAA
jgi:hypothetical protein